MNCLISQAEASRSMCKLRRVTQRRPWYFATSRVPIFAPVSAAFPAEPCVLLAKTSEAKHFRVTAKKFRSVGAYARLASKASFASRSCTRAAKEQRARASLCGYVAPGASKQVALSVACTEATSYAGTKRKLSLGVKKPPDEPASCGAINSYVFCA